MNLKDYLHSKGIKQVEIARETKLSPAMVSLILNGVVACPKKHQEKLAKFLGITAQEIQTNHVTQKGGGNEC